MKFQKYVLLAFLSAFFVSGIVKTANITIKNNHFTDVIIMSDAGHIGITCSDNVKRLTSIDRPIGGNGGSTQIPDICASALSTAIAREVQDHDLGQVLSINTSDGTTFTIQ